MKRSSIPQKEKSEERYQQKTRQPVNQKKNRVGQIGFSRSRHEMINLSLQPIRQTCLFRKVKPPTTCIFKFGVIELSANIPQVFGIFFAQNNLSFALILMYSSVVGKPDGRFLIPSSKPSQSFFPP